MKNKIYILVVLSIFFSLPVAFAQTNIKAEVDRTSITTDDTLTYKLAITSSEKELPAPTLPSFSGFDVVSQAQSSTVTFTKTKIKTIVVYVYILGPKEVGKIKIEPSQIKLGSSVYSSDSFEIEVKQGQRIPKSSKQAPQPDLPQESPAEAEKLTL
jgi:hypothetical protein